MALIRLNKYLAQNSRCSRRSADALILAGKVSINGKRTNELGIKIDDEKDKISLNGENISKQENTIYYALNKPVGYITTSSDPRGRKKVIDLVPKYPKVYPVGRLDYDSEGLIILTNDGDFTYRMIHPKFEKEKEYAIVAVATKKIPMTNTQYSIWNYIKDKFLKGIKLKEGIAIADKLSFSKEKVNQVEFNIVLHQGWNRQIRRMCATVGLDVLSLKRVRIGNLNLGNIKIGEYKILDEKTIKKI